MARGRRLWIVLIGVGLLMCDTAPRAQAPEMGAVIDQYQRGEFSAAVRAAAPDDIRDLRQLMPRLTGAMPPLLPELPGAWNEKRRLAIATLALEVVMARRSTTFSDSGRLLLEWACSLLRKNPSPLPAERLWHLAAIGVMEGAPDSTTLDTHLTHAEKRFPKEPRFVLARAVVEEMKSWPVAYMSGADALVSQFRIAVLTPAVRDEALLRWGFFDERRGSFKSALEHLSAIGPQQEPYLEYLRHLFLGRALDRAKKPDEAIESYRRAVAVEPHAQTAQLALAAALAAGNKREDAFAALRQAVSGPGDVLADPWFTYGAGDQRYWPALVTELRQAVRR